MTPKLKAAYNAELAQGQTQLSQGNLEAAYHHLERAHILGQRHYVAHVRSHYWLLRAGLKAGDGREVAGQLVRIIGSVGSLVGWVPLGNNGRATVSAIKPMPIPDDLRAYLE